MIDCDILQQLIVRQVCLLIVSCSRMIETCLHTYVHSQPVMFTCHWRALNALDEAQRKQGGGKHTNQRCSSADTPTT